MVRSAYVPDTGHVIKVDFDPQTGHEQSGWRPAIVLSPASYNRPTGLAVVVPIANQKKGYPFEVPLPSGLRTTGVVLADAIRNLDWRARNARYLETTPTPVLVQIRERLGLLLGFDQ
jgi:mRNA interferase MazF